jgi:hypothetical protein
VQQRGDHYHVPDAPEEDDGGLKRDDAAERLPGAYLPVAGVWVLRKRRLDGSDLLSG